ncbi:MAG: CpaF family protein, partial [Anaerolineales bacterium]|nr:CpaF family protein [Anaerolineales bacterium]
MSLLKRIEQGKQPGEDGGSMGDSSSRLGTLEARRVSPPRKDAQDETYADLKVRVQNRLLAEL